MLVKDPRIPQTVSVQKHFLIRQSCRARYYLLIAVQLVALDTQCTSHDLIRLSTQHLTRQRYFSATEADKHPFGRWTHSTD